MRRCSSHLVLALNEQVQDILSDLVVVFIEELVNLHHGHENILEYLSGIREELFPSQQVLCCYACTDCVEKLVVKMLKHLWMEANQ